MQANFLRTLWIMFMSVVLILSVSFRALGKSVLGTMSRKWCDQTLNTWAKRTLALLNVHYRIHNPHQISPKAGIPTIIVCNHASHYDIPLSFLIFPNISLRMLAKKELGRIPIWGNAMRAAGFPFVDRQNRRKAIENLQHVEELLKTGIVMWIAPEGGRSANGQLLPFKKGAFITAIQTHATIIPVVIRGANEILPARTWKFKLNQQVDIYVDKPIDASKYSLDNKEVLIETVFNRMHDLLLGNDHAGH
jgi:1-acyl-sn-glycerol-3-phosphate acyltransferase